MTEAQLRRAVERELRKRERLERAIDSDQGPQWSLKEFCGDHAAQLAACLDRSNWIHLMCDRQSGKTWADMGILLDNALAVPNSVNIFLGLVGVGLEVSVWPKWKLLLDKYNVRRQDNEALRITYFPNGALVVFAGTDDLRNVKKLLGNRLDGCVFIVDESQDQATSILRYLFEQLLPPMMTPTTRVIMSGVLPDLPVGYFLDAAEFDAESKTGGKGKRWSHHSWGRLSNPFTPEAAIMLAKLEAEKGADDPQLQRDWKGCRRVWDSSLTAYRYSAARDQWTGIALPSLAPDMLPPGRLMAVKPIVTVADPRAPGGFRTVVLDRFSIGLDPAATADRFAIVLWGWSSTQRLGLWQLAEWVTPRAANALESQWLEVVKVLKREYAPWGNITRVIRDAGSSRQTNDLLWQSHGLMIEPAIKGPGSLRARVDRLADVLGTGQGHILAGSELENDLKLAKWSLKAREEGRWEFDAAHHPDVADAGTYGAVAYYEQAPIPEVHKQVSEEEALKRDAAAAIKQAYDVAQAPPLMRPRDSSSIWGGRGQGW